VFLPIGGIADVVLCYFFGRKQSMPVITKKQTAVETQPVATSGGVRYDKALMAPGEYEVTKDSLFTVVIPLAKGKSNWWVIVEEKDATTIKEVVFRMWTYDEMVEMRKMATQYDQLRRIHMIDHDIMNRLKIQQLMVRWTFGNDNPRLTILHVNKVMSDESWDAVRKLQTNILRYIIEQMNEVLEYGS
jgi:hypothetical protein